MVEKILFFGNCQAAAIMKCLNLKVENYITHYEPCHLSELSNEQFTKMIKEQDIIITQPIAQNYRNLDYLNTNYIINNTDAIVIIFNSCYFEFYYPDLKYFKRSDGLLKQPIDYHYQCMIDHYMRGDNIQQYVDECVNNPDLYSKEFFLDLANKSIKELRNRDAHTKKELCTGNNVHFISITDFIEQNYRDKLLFYSMNHPSKYLLHFVSESIIRILNIGNTIDYNADPLSNPKCILYKSLQSGVNFKVNNDFETKGLKDLLSITELYFNTYDEIDLKNTK